MVVILSQRPPRDSLKIVIVVVSSVVFLFTFIILIKTLFPSKKKIYFGQALSHRLLHRQRNIDILTLLQIGDSIRHKPYHKIMTMLLMLGALGGIIYTSILLEKKKS
jgi:hypothetical protein